MKKYRDRDFREALQHISTPELDTILQEELSHTPVDQGSIKIILRELKEREREQNHPFHDGLESGKSWIRYLSHIKNDERSEKRKNGRLFKGTAAALLALVLLAWLPQEAAAKGFFERLSRWTDEFLEVFSPDEVNENQYAYSFTTDHPGLQKVHDAVVKMGVTGPAVPMWLPEGYELVELKEYGTDTYTTMLATFSDEIKEIVLQIVIYNDNPSRKIYKNEKTIIEYEFMGTLFQIVSKKESHVIYWTQGNCELFFSVKCPEEVVFQIIHSIYATEENFHAENLKTTLCIFDYRINDYNSGRSSGNREYQG